MGPSIAEEMQGVSHQGDGAASDSDPAREQVSGDSDDATLSAAAEHDTSAMRDAKQPHGEDEDRDDAASYDSWDEYEAPQLDLNYDAIKHVATYYLPGSHGECIDITTLRRGTYHEIRILHFADGWSCIGRFTREDESLAKTESELATIEYVRQHTTIPVPEIYFVNFNRNHVVGAAFVFMERMEGVKGSGIWDRLSTEHKVAIIDQLADLIGQLADIKFDAIGSLRSNGKLGPLLNTERAIGTVSAAPFPTTKDYFFATLDEDNWKHPETARVLYPQIKAELDKMLKDCAHIATLYAPYCLIHADLDIQNILILQGDKDKYPKISAIIDWDWSYVGPAYYLFDYPQFLVDWHREEAKFAENKILRKRLVKGLLRHFPPGSFERQQIKQCFREKCYKLNFFPYFFMDGTWEDPQYETEGVQGFLAHLRGKDSDGTDYDRSEDCAYGDREEWEADTEVESGHDDDA